ncbi:tetratricopeptide repeat protein [Pelagicoccus mobilis]|uniref:Tetratricopeptide repeat protein n=1 Tax=Pelagicoccus mobilis TaxID=415221 RepID=A0A934RXC3_9BACT|nr:hypothetical protein [Pelagicoccus mobilis]MBK1876526.1 hypothetical protein [Pelagicoccus mobilis]
MLTERDQILFKKALTYANGYRELGMFDDALTELKNLDTRYENEKELLQMQLAILMEARRWKKALPIANLLAANHSSDPGNLVNLAYVTRRANSLEGARIILENAAKRFPKEAIIQYNLGCYACCNDDLDTAKKHLLVAFSLDKNYLDMSDTDDDLEPLRDWLNSIPKPDET